MGPLRNTGMSLRKVARLGVICGVAWACGGERNAGDPGPAKGDDHVRPSGLEPASAPLPALPMGMTDLAGFAYSRGPGREALMEALALDKREGPKDWAGIAERCRAALAADAGHLEAHWYLALALAHQSQHAQVAQHLSAAVAGDWMRWGERSLSIKALQPFYDSAQGRPYRALVDRYRQRFRQLIADGVPVVGRRGLPWYPRNPGDGALNHRSELYVYGPREQRFVRLSRTNGALVGFLPSPSGTELAYVSYRAVWTPTRVAARATPDSDPDAPLVGPAPGAGTPHIRELTIGTIDLDNATMSRKDVQLTGVQELWLAYDQAPYGKSRNGQLVAWVRSPVEATGNHSTAQGPAATTSTLRIYDLDVARGRAALRTAQREDGRTDDDPGDMDASDRPQGDVLRVAYDAVERRRIPIAGVVADWDENGGAGSFRLLATRKTVTLPSGLLADGNSMSWSPSRTRLAFVDLPGDPCARMSPGAKRALYIVEAATGALRERTTAAGLQAPTWLDDRQLAIAIGSRQHSAVQLLDVESDGAPTVLSTAGGLGTAYIPARAFPIADCPDANDASDQGDESEPRPR